MKNMKDKITRFNLEDAFKALDEIDMPKVKGIRPNRPNLKEDLKVVDRTDVLLEDYYDLNSEEELQEAQADRDEEIAKAKLARIEKIVDLDADSPEDIQPSYAGKFIIQCPQCMTMFYKDEADIEHSEEDPDAVNVGEVCQHCGNDSGYMLIGKVAPINNDEAANYQQAEEENNFEEGGEDKDLDVQPAEENNEEAQAEENNEELPADETNAENELTELEPSGNEENAEEEPEEEKKEEAFVQPTGEALVENANIEEKCELDEAATAKYKFYTEYTDGQTVDCVKDNLTKAEVRAIINELKDDEDVAAIYVSKMSGNNEIPQDTFTIVKESLKESAEEDLNKKLDEHNSYIQYLQDEIKKQEEALKNAKNEFVKGSIQKQIDALKADLDSAIPKEVKQDVEEETTELPTPEEAIDELNAATENKEEQNNEKSDKVESNKDEEVKESLTESDQQIVDKIKAHYGTEELSDSTIRKMLKIYVNDTGVKKSKIDLNDFYDWVDDPGEFLFDFVDDIIDACDGDAKKAMPVAQDIAFASKKMVNFCKKYCIDGKIFRDEETGKLEEHPDDFYVKFIFDKEEDLKKTLDGIKNKYRALKESCKEIKEDAEIKLDDSAQAVDKMLDSKEFEKPVSESEVDSYIADAVKEDPKLQKEAEEKTECFDFNKVSDLDEASINEHISNYLTETYSNVENFEMTGCAIRNNNLIIEGAINFKSGKVKNTAFTFTPVKECTQHNPVFEGLNEDFAEGNAFTLNCKADSADTYLIVESIGYKYSINNNLVEGLK